MTRLTISSLSAGQLEQAGASFIERQAARSLGRADAHTAAGRRDTIRAVRRVLTGAADPRSVLLGLEIVPIEVLGLVRELLARQSAAASLQARAASSSDGVRRDAGDFELSLIEDEDVTFVIIDLGEELLLVPPTRMTLLGADGAVMDIDLPAPVDAAIQIGIARAHPRHREQVDLLADPQTSIFLS